MVPAQRHHFRGSIEFHCATSQRNHGGVQRKIFVLQRLNISHHLAFTLVGVKYRVDRKSTRLNSSHLGISYAVFCLKKKNKKTKTTAKTANTRNATLHERGRQKIDEANAHDTDRAADTDQLGHQPHT